MFDKFLDLIGLSNSARLEERTEERANRFNPTRNLQREAEKQKRPQIKEKRKQQTYQDQIDQLKKIIIVPKQYKLQVNQFKNERNWYIFAKDQPQKQQKCQLLLPFCQKVTTSFVFIADYDRILSKIGHVNFSQLTNLILIQCNIANIQAIALLEAPQLRNLYLDHNKITSIKPLLKTRFCLSVLSLTQNPLIQIDLSRMHMKQNCIGPQLSIFLSNLFRIESPFIKLFKIQTQCLNLSDYNNTEENQHHKRTKAFSKLDEKFISLNYNQEGIRQVQQFIETKFEYLFMQRLQKRKRNIFIIQQP